MLLRPVSHVTQENVRFFGEEGTPCRGLMSFLRQFLLMSFCSVPLSMPFDGTYLQVHCHTNQKKSK